MTYGIEQYKQETARQILSEFEKEIAVLLTHLDIFRFKVAGVKDTAGRTGDSPMAAITAYRSRDTSQVIHLLNQRQDQHIFAMPPLFGYAMAFTNLASHIQNHSWYGLDFIEDDDRIQRYADILIKHQPDYDLPSKSYQSVLNLMTYLN